MEKLLEKNYKLIVILILTFMLVVSVLNAWNDSAIFDETAHIGAAYSYVTQHEMRLNPEHPPLIKNLAGLPLLLLNLNFDTNQAFWNGTLPGKWDEGQWIAGRYLLYQAGNNPDKIIFWARFPIVLLSLILGLFIFKWSKELAGTLAGIIALTLYAFDPNILGHNHFVTTDLGIAAFMTFSFYYYLKFIKHPTWKNMFLAGIFLGLLQLTKFSFLVALPVLGLATIIYPFITRLPATEKNALTFRIKKIAEYLSKGALALVLSVLVVWVVYAANTFNMQKETVAQAVNSTFPPSDTANIKNVYTNKTLHWLNDNSITRPLTEYGLGIGYVFRRVSGGNGAYFMGQVSSAAFRNYFPVVFIIKESIPALFLILIALLLSSLKIARAIKKSFGNLIRNTSRYLQTHIAESSMAMFILIYSYISITGNLNIGFRHLFPILPFIYILTAKSITGLFKDNAPNHKAVASYERNSLKALSLEKQETNRKQKIRIFSVGFFLIFAYLIWETIFAYPSYMSYFNKAVGGPKNGYKLVTDSNADWGQDLKRLKAFIGNYNECAKCFLPQAETNGISMNFLNCKDFRHKNCQKDFGNVIEITRSNIDKIRVDYFGGGDQKTYLGEKFVPWWDSKRPLEPGWYAISVNFLQGSIYSNENSFESNYQWTQKIKPVYQVGTSILIYYISKEDISKITE